MLAFHINLHFSWAINTVPMLPIRLQRRPPQGAFNITSLPVGCSSLVSPPTTPNHKRFREVKGFVLKISQDPAFSLYKESRASTIFAARHEALSHNEDRPVALRIIFHSTRRTTPEAIISSVAGFDSHWIT